MLSRRYLSVFQFACAGMLVGALLASSPLANAGPPQLAAGEAAHDDAHDHDHSKHHGSTETEESLAVSVAKFSPLNTDTSKQFSVTCGNDGVPAGCNFAFFLGAEPACKSVDKSKLVVTKVAATKGAMKGCTVEAAAPPAFSTACPWQIGVQAVCIHVH